MVNIEERNDMIDQLSQIKPRYVQSYENFEPGDPIYYSGPYFDRTELKLAMECLLTSKWLSAGPYVERFQNAFSEKYNVKHTLMVNSGSSANLVMLAALKKRFGWKDDSEIIVSPVGFPTTIAPIVQNRMKPVFIDIEWDTLNFDISQIEAKITDKTVAIFVSPVLGNPPDMDFLKILADRNGLKLIGDNCDSLGSRYNGKLLGDYYEAWSCSFYAAHHLSTGEGGSVSTNDEQILTLARSFAWWGKACYCVGSANLISCGTCGKRFDRWLEGYDGLVDHRFTFDNMGYNLKPIDIQGAFGLAQIAKADKIDHRRKNNKKLIENIILKYLDVKTAIELPQSESSWFGCPVICPSREYKEKLINYLEGHGLQIRPYFSGNILLHAGYKHLDGASKYPEANKVLDKVFFIGCPPMYNEKVINYIEKIVSEFNYD